MKGDITPSLKNKENFHAYTRPYCFVTVLHSEIAYPNRTIVCIHPLPQINTQTYYICTQINSQTCTLRVDQTRLLTFLCYFRCGGCF